MKCSKCGNDKTACIDSRDGSKPFTRNRRYKCAKCAQRFSTVEFLVSDQYRGGAISMSSDIVRQAKVTAARELIQHLEYVVANNESTTAKDDAKGGGG